MSRKWVDLTLAQWLAAGVVAVALFAASFVPGSITSPMEAFGFIFGVWAVYLVVKEEPWNWPLGIITSAAYVVVFAQARLWGDMGLNGLYVILCALGWYWWLRGGEGKAELPMTRTPPHELALCLIGVVLATGGFYAWFTTNHNSAPLLDAITTSISLGAQYLQMRKHLENWALWILVNAIYIPLYFSRGLWLTAVLYGIYLALAILGHRTWTANLNGKGTKSAALQ
ncbi:MAG: nicotinamide riboside transporter PnuC [Fimbriimonas sp.]